MQVSTSSGMKLIMHQRNIYYMENGNEHRLLTLKGEKNAVDGYSRIPSQVKLRDSEIILSREYLTGHLFQAKNTNKCSSKNVAPIIGVNFDLD